MRFKKKRGEKIMIDEKRWDRLLNSIKMSIFMNCDLIDLNHGSDK